MFIRRTAPVPAAMVAGRLDAFLESRRAAGRGIPVWPDDAYVFSSLTRFRSTTR